jgi:ribosomal protein L44E
MFSSDIRELKEALNISIKRLNERSIELETTHGFQLEKNDQHNRHIAQISKKSYSDFRKRLLLELENTSKLRKKIENESIWQNKHEQKLVVASSIASQKNEIAELQKKRQRIIDEIGSQSKSEFKTEKEMKAIDLNISTATKKSPSEPHQNSLQSSIQKCIDHQSQYSIEGIVKLASIQQKSFSRDDGLIIKHAILHNKNTQNANHDTLSEVLHIQLQLADTITRLERSVHLRDLILASASECPSRSRFYHRKSNSLFEDDSESDSYVSEQSVESDYTMRRHAKARKTIEEPVNEVSPDGHFPVGPNTTEISSSLSSGVKEKDTVSSPTILSIEPYSKNLKQVRFHESDYPTPLVARNLSFGDHSEDDIDSESVFDLSFLRESQLSLSDLSNESFVHEFESFRQELRASEGESTENRSNEDEIGSVSSEDSGTIVTSPSNTKVFEDNLGS